MSVCLSSLMILKPQAKRDRGKVGKGISQAYVVEKFASQGVCCLPVVYLKSILAQDITFVKVKILKISAQTRALKLVCLKRQISINNSLL